MKRNSSMNNRWQVWLFAIAAVLCGLRGPAYCETNGSALLVQQTPPQGGTITPDVGVHHFGLNAAVTLEAVPKAGYQFIYWLGDVGNPTANRTIIYLDTPKIVIATFELAEYELLDVEEESRSASVGGMFASAADHGRGGLTGFGGGGGKKAGKLIFSPAEPPVEGSPAPTPEPTTLYLLSLGGLTLLLSKRTGGK